VFIFIYFSVREMLFQKCVCAYYHGIISIYKTKLQIKLIFLIEIRTVGGILVVFFSQKYTSKEYRFINQNTVLWTFILFKVTSIILVVF
jgi:hypothetical protein